MKKTIQVTQPLIVLLLLLLILAPRIVFGALELGMAEQLDAVGDESASLTAYALAASRLPWMPWLWEKAGIKALETENDNKAIAYLNKAAERHVISAYGWLALGNAYQQQGELSLAIEAWQFAMPIAQAASNLAKAERSQGNFTQAIAAWQVDIAQEPGNPTAHYTLGLLLVANAPDQALAELMQAETLDPTLNTPVQSLRTVLNSAIRSQDKAYQFLSGGRALGALCEWDLAEEAFHNSINERTNYAEGWAWLSEAKQQQGQDGRIEIEEAISLNPQSAMVQGLYGLYLSRQGKLTLARAAFQKAADLEPEDPGWQIALGTISEQAGDLVTAYTYYLRAVELAPGEASTWYALATFSLTNLVDVESSGLPAATKLLSLAPNDWQSYDLAGEAELLLENFTEAENFLKKAVQMSSTQSSPALHLGLLYLKIGRRDLAYSYLTLAETVDPNGANGWQAGRLLEQYFP